MKKDLNWFKEQLDDIEMNTPMLWSHTSIWMLDKVNELLDQLDEPEVLSQEWIDKNSTLGQFATSDVINFDKFVKADKLKNLIVPKQELPVIPKFVAEYIDGRKKVGFPIYQAIRIVREISSFEHSQIREWLWTNKGQETFVRAWLDGFTVEEEQKYRVVDRHEIHLLAKEEGHNKVETVAELVEIYGHEYVELDYNLTEQEIKDYDERYWAFRKPVEELEE